MNVLVINGSPKAARSNSMKLTQAFLEGAGYSADVIHVAESVIKPCLGCFYCWEKKPGQCVIKDDMAAILQKIIAADIIIWSFPLYYFSVPGALKILIDRQLPLNLPIMSEGNESGGHPPRYDLSHQHHIVISTCGFWKSQGNYDGVTALFDHLYGKEGYAKIFCSQGELLRVPELKTHTDAYFETARKAGAEFAKDGISSATQAELEAPMFSREAFEHMADASWQTAENGTQQTDDSLNFTRQMAALYRPDGKERVLEIHYTEIDKTYQLLLTPQGSHVVTDGFKPYTTRIETPYDLWKSIARGEISGQDALFQKKYRISGNFEIMLHWDDLFGGAPSSPAQNRGKKSLTTNMLVFLAPWIAIWTALAINPIAGGVLGIITSSMIPLIWLAVKPTLFERISILAVAGLSLWALSGADLYTLLPISYGMFGLMWLVSAFCKIPLSAHYSQNDYGGSRALENPLFLRTNRILTACWGVLYLLTPFWTYRLMATGASPFTGLINSAAPIIMGGFTKWFQKWYPARWARKDIRCKM